MRQRFKNCFIRLRCPEVKYAVLFGEDGSDTAPGPEGAELARPRPTSCTVLEEAVKPRPGLGAMGRSVDQNLTRCTELSKLLHLLLGESGARDNEVLT